MLVDGSLQDYLRDHYKAQKVTDNEVLVSLPSAPYHYLEELSDFFDELNKYPGVHCEHVQIGYDVARHAIMDDDTHKEKAQQKDIVLDSRIYGHSAHTQFCNCTAHRGELTCDSPL